MSRTRASLKAATTILGLLVVSCAAPVAELTPAPPAWVHAPAAGGGISGEWWNAYGDPALGGMIQRAWSENPDLDALVGMAGRARAERMEALGMLFPTAGLNVGYGANREQSRMTMFRPERMEPWGGEAMLAWELDLTGKRRAILSAAKDREAAAWARVRGARLMLASEVAAARFEALALAGEISLLREQTAAELESVRLTRGLVEAGLATSADVADRTADAQAFARMTEDLERQQALTGLRLARLTGGRASGSASRGVVPRIPETPQRVPEDVFASRPDLVAAEAEVRAAFAIEQAARLNLLPTLSLAAGAEGGADSPTGGFRTWMTSVGPRLEIPVWDPSRIAAVSRGRAEAVVAAANYRSTALNAVEEIEGGHINFRSHLRQLRSAESEEEARRQAWSDAGSLFASGLISSIEATEFRHSYYAARRVVWRLRLRALNDHLALVRALGG